MNEEIIQQSIQSPKATKGNLTTSDSITALLNSLFPEQQQQDKELRQVKAILGSLANELTIDEIHALTCEVRFLLESWLDSFEEDIFEGKTLKDVLNEG